VSRRRIPDSRAGSCRHKQFVPCQKPTADRDAFQRYVCPTWKRMSCQTLVIRRGSEAQRRARGTPSRRQVTYVPYDPSFEMPDEGVALTNATQSPGESRPYSFRF
jgi:hypothetical protein